MRAFSQTLCLVVMIVGAACTKKPPPSRAKPVVIKLVGADSAVGLARSWADGFTRGAPDIEIEVSGGGSGIGIQALINSTADIATATRALTPQENESFVAKFGAGPVVSKRAVECLCVLVHKDNPVASLTLGQLKEIFQEEGRLTTGPNLA